MLQIDVANYKDEIIETHLYSIPSKAMGEINYQNMEWNLDVNIQHGSWKLKVKDQV